MPEESQDRLLVMNFSVRFRRVAEPLYAKVV